MKKENRTKLFGLTAAALLTLCSCTDPDGDPISSQGTETAKQTEAVISQTSEPQETENEPRDGIHYSSNGKKIEQINGITYVDGILIANKTYSLPSDYAPGVDPTAQAALNELISAAAKEGHTLYLMSGYRSYERQYTLYHNYGKRDGYEAADTYSARPGFSEHQTGLAFDMNSVEISWGKTPEGQWLKNHCAEYGFIIRYPENMTDITGYIYEPWHIRYLGVETAKAVTESGLTLEEYLGITSSYEDYDRLQSLRQTD